MLYQKCVGDVETPVPREVYSKGFVLLQLHYMYNHVSVSWASNKYELFSLMNLMYWLSTTWFNRHSSCTTNVYKLDANAGASSNLSCASMHLGCLVPAD